MTATGSFKRLFFSFDGRINRATYWTRAVPVFLASALLVNAAFAIETRILLRPAVVSYAISLASLWPVLAVTVKRLHDRGRSAWFLLTVFIPIAGPIWLLVEVWILPGADRANLFGDPPSDKGLERRWVVPCEIASAAALILLIVWTYSLPAPVSNRAVEVDVAVAREDLMVVTLRGEGVTRVAASNSGDMEVVADYPVADAASINPGQRVVIEYQGVPVAGRVRNVEPSFSTISALGVDEQRSNVIIDVIRTTDSGQLPVGHRVPVKIVTWEDGAALSIPRGALFRRGSEWAVFVDLDGRAQLRIVTIGHMSDVSAEVLAGIEADDKVILYPGTMINDGVRIRSHN